MSTSTNSFLRAQRKSSLLELADKIGLKDTEGLRKNELELALDNYLTENQDYSLNPLAAPFYQARSKATGSPIKRELAVVEPRRRRGAAKLAEHAISEAAADDSEAASPATATATATATPAAAAGDRTRDIVRRVPLPATPADVARIVDERTLAVRERVSDMVADSGAKDFAYDTRDALSTVNSIILSISAFELYHLRKEILADRYAFTIPAIHAFGTSDYAVKVPDMFLLLSGSFWAPLLLWLTTSVILPSIFGFYFNLPAAHSTAGSRGRGSPSAPTIDPLTFSIAKAVITYVIYQQGASFGGWVSQDAVARINSAVYGGWKGVLTGAFISGVASFYDAVLRR